MSASRKRQFDTGLAVPRLAQSLDGGRLEHRADEHVIVGAPVSAIHVDQMDPARSRTRERVERRERLAHGAVRACHAPACDVNGGIELHVGERRGG